MYISLLPHCRRKLSIQIIQRSEVSVLRSEACLFLSLPPFPLSVCILSQPRTIQEAIYQASQSLLGAFWNILSFGVLPLELDNETKANVAEMTGAAPFDEPVMASGHMIQHTSTRRMENHLFVPFPLIILSV